MRLLFTIILFIQPIFAEKMHSISGTVINEKGIPIENVFVQIKNLDITSTTDASGYFLLQLDSSGAYELTFKHIAYIKHTQRLDSRTKEIKVVTLKVYTIPSDEVVVTSTRKEVNIKDSPNLTYVISSNDIKNTSSSTVKEMIEFAIPNIQSIHDNHGNDKIKIQGLDNKYVTFLLDGNRISGEFAGGVDFSLFDLNNVERIEVVRGGLSTLYGSGAMGSVINIITKKRSNSYWLDISTMYDDPLIFDKSFSAGFNYKNLSYDLFIDHKSSDGYDLTTSNYSDGITTNIEKTLEKYNSISISQKLKLKLNQSLSLMLNLRNYNKEILKYKQLNNPSLNCTCLQNENPYFSDRILSFSLRKRINAKSNLFLSYQNEEYSKSYYYPYYNTSIESLTSNVGEFYFNSLDLDGETKLWSTPKTKASSVIYDVMFKKHIIMIGLDYIDESYKSQNIYNISGDTLLVSSIFDDNKIYSRDEISFFLTDNFNANKLEFNIGLRANYKSKYKTKYSPSISIKGGQLENYNIRLNYSHNYRTPSIKELYYEFPDHQAGFPVLGNSNLNPSTSNYYSISIESTEHLDRSVEFYYNDVSNMIANKFEVIENQTVYMYYNYKEVDLYGLNINSSFNISNNFILNSVYSYTGARSRFEDVMDGISKHSIKTRLNYIFPHNINMGLSVHYNSKKRIDVSLEDQSNDRTEIDLPGYSLTNIILTKNFMSNLYVKFGVKNLFDYTDHNTKFPDFLSTYMPGRRFFVSVNLDYSGNIK